MGEGRVSLTHARRSHVQARKSHGRQNGTEHQGTLPHSAHTISPTSELAPKSRTCARAPSTCPNEHCSKENGAVAAFADGFKHGMPAILGFYGFGKSGKGDEVPKIMRSWTKRRGEVSIPLNKGVKENEDIVRAVESEIEESGISTCNVMWRTTW